MLSSSEPRAPEPAAQLPPRQPLLRRASIRTVVVLTHHPSVHPPRLPRSALPAPHTAPRASHRPATTQPDCATRPDRKHRPPSQPTDRVHPRDACRAQEWANNGHGRLDKITDQKDFFAVSKQSKKVIVLFTRDANKYGAIMKEHMTVLAQQHMEARFVWVDAEKAPFITEKLNIWMLPTIVCIVDNKVKEQHNGLNEIDGSGKYTTGMLEYLLHLDGMLDEAPSYDREIQEEEEELADIED